MEANNTKDFNLFAKIILGLSMAQMAGHAISSIMTYWSYASLGMGESNIHHIILVGFNILLLIFAAMIFAKNKFGLIAFMFLAIIRMFAVFPYNTTISYSYYLGGNFVEFLRDAGFFAIALCFRKNGISGWHSLLSNKRFASTSTTEVPKVEIPDETSIPANNIIDTLVVDNIKDASKTTVELEDQVNGRNSKQYKKVRFLLIGLFSLFLLILGYFLLIKSYPSYINSVTDKVRYVFKLPNNNLASYCFDEAMKIHPSDGVLVEKQQYVSNNNNTIEFYHEWYIYHNIDNFKTGYKTYAVKGFIEEKKDIKENAYYWIRVAHKYDAFKDIIYSGSDLLRIYDDLIQEYDNVTCEKILPFDLEKQYKTEKELISATIEIPTNNLELIKKVSGYFFEAENKTLRLEYFGKNLNYNKNSKEFIDLYTDVLIEYEEYIKAEQLAKEAIEKDPKDSHALSILAYTTSVAGEWGKAQEYAQKAIDYDTEESSAYYVMAEALYRKGYKSEARAIYNRGINKPRYSDLRYKYENAGGCPFELLSIEIGFTNSDGKVIIDYGNKLYSNKSRYISPKVYVRFDRYKRDFKLQYKLYRNDKLVRNSDNNTNYTYEEEEPFYGINIGTDQSFILAGWGNDTPGTWQAGNYRFEVYYNGELIGLKTFQLY